MEDCCAFSLLVSGLKHAVELASEPKLPRAALKAQLKDLLETAELIEAEVHADDAGEELPQ